MESNDDKIFQLFRRCEDQAASSCGGCFPVRLPKLVAQRGVKRLWFQPMMADGVVGYNADGFLIGIHADEGECRECEATFEAGEQNLLPFSKRFAIAHELAHTFFYDTGNPNLASEQIVLRAGGGKTAQENLERNCDRLAASILLPGRMLRERLGIGTRDPDVLRRVAEDAGVSLVTLIIRCDELKIFDNVYPPVAHMVFRRREGIWAFVRGAFSPGFAISKLRQLVGGDPLQDWLTDPSSMLLGGSERDVALALPVHTFGGIAGSRHCRVISEGRIDSNEKAYTVVSVVDLLREE